MSGATEFRRTKIVATLGPATDGAGALRAILEAGVDIVRVNASHGNEVEWRRRIAWVRRLETKLSRPIPVLFDLSGPKIRTGWLPSGRRRLSAGERVVLAPEKIARPGEIPVTYRGLARDVSRGDRILVDDGLFEWFVERVIAPRVICRVRVGGVLRDRKGLNFPGVRLSIGSLTAKDRRDLAVALSSGADFLAQSFVRSARDIAALRRLVAAAGADIPIIAKIEKPEALEDLDAILAVADGIMVARGDLGVEMPPQKVPEIQKMLIRRANEEEVPVITATQMLESMIERPRPTRAEASDVANAIFDGTDAVMLSGETAIGRSPAGAVAMMERIAGEAERSPYVPEPVFSRRAPSVPHAVAVAAAAIAREIGARGVVCFTESGRTALLLSKVIRGRPIFAVSRRTAKCRRTALYPGVIPMRLDMPRDTDRMIGEAKRMLRRSRRLVRGDAIVIVSGSTRTRGATNLIKVDTL
jgi:pyruvate kinase